MVCSFLKQARSQVDSNPGDARKSGRIQPLTQQQNDIRKEESFLVNVWSSDNFPKLGGLLTVIILFLVILSGPP
ncbi:hypothetical protein DUNSADRAFT_14691 [Dunaliella salina]|uniref:Uncharacterized protein n=1 Tax=Dunaliella salina TaxID=3046 RepID=A0ABQ7G6Y3_DUNSA|nr:hypothetical protein DUNSADRAFT_14691 [Dunaliella salina]|eukprot:KAF5830351.1 hypothetical protein DUNSADRAFT_14691 [Dunaliella salina]